MKIKYLIFILVFIFNNIFFLIPETKAQTTPDPGIVGPFTVSKAEYNLGDLAFKPADFPDSVEVRGSVIYPTGLPAGPYPVIVFLHGRHDVCYQVSNPANLPYVWPCPTGCQPIVSYEGYDYLSNNLASHGYIVISISCNAINATDNAVGDYGMQGRAELMQHHLDLWNSWNTAGGGPFGSYFVGKLNMQNIGTMGHSRGGEGVIYHALYNASLGSPYGIKAVLTLAPVDFNRHVLHGIPILNIAPYCDGDVSNLMGVHFYDDARYTDTSDVAPKHNILYMGANHDYFNTVWTPGSYIAGGADDWLYGYSDTDPQCGAGFAGTKRFDSTKQKNALLPYLCAFFRIYIGHEYQFTPILNVDDIIPPTSSTLDTNDVYVSFHPSKINRLDINRTDSADRLNTNTLQDTVFQNGLVVGAICGGGYSNISCNISPNGNQEPHKGTATTSGLGAMNLQWNSIADFYENEIPQTRQNLTHYQDLIFRATVNYNLSVYGQRLNFSVQLIDSAGNTSSQLVDNFTHALFYQPGTQSGDLPKAMFNTIKIPLKKFTGINLAKVRKVKFLFNKTANGSMLISDLAFSSKPCNSFIDSFSTTLLPENVVIFNNNSIPGKGDSLTYHRQFGEGLSDTSNLQNPPIHTYPGYGYYTACLYVTSYQQNGFTCLDTFCRNLTLHSTGFSNIEEEKITISPNPTKDFINITGALLTDEFLLYNLYGQLIISQILNIPIVNIPTNIPNGIYYIKILTKYGIVNQKILIER